MASTEFSQTTDAAVRRVERVRFGAGRIDYVLLLTVAALLFIGLMMVYSTTFDWSYTETGSPMTFMVRQALWVALGLVAMVSLSRIDYLWWRRLAVPVMGMSLVLLVLVLVFGSVRFGAQRTFLNGSVQPSEPAKLAVVVYIAAWLSSKGEKIRQLSYGLIPFSVLIGVIAGLIVLQPDFSTAVLVVLTAITMFFIAGADLLQVGLGCLVGGGTFYLLISNSLHGSERLGNYIATWSDPTLASHHVRQALVALGSGGLFGRGLGAGYQKFGYLPAPHTDSVFAVLGEELGLVGCVMVVALFALFAQRGFKIAMEARDPFGAVLAIGVTCWLVFQAFINVAVMTATIPFTGIPLPFLSLGGSAMVSSLAAVGLLLSVSRGSQATIASGARRQTNLDGMRSLYKLGKGGRRRAGSVLRRRNRRSRVSRVVRR